ncbi:tripartite tricarboxylate transporter substrate binding protein [Cupriavidus basilensis]|uniref:Tripartite tricarboxylate transporter substrate binding protein n=1 Tax=Cupriavidus basilensis TaxID=68895 RepID=A0ABT6AXT4_9BURK|nr:tripartite tricarboxylate transporter substrate binding protein [Cupriavidus basilensis]MDF3837443.1 tripartite tricarboxylate transporter substrate binding protein [Cupriavidus basilensis]
MIKRHPTLLFLMASALAGPVLAADAFPSKPIRIVIGFPAGGGADNVARLYGDALSKELGQPVIVDNKPGAGTTIAADTVAKAPADGYTLYIATASLMGGDKVLYKTIRYEPTDFAPITRLTASPLLLAASKGAGIGSVAELLAKARQHPGELNYSSSGNGVITHLAGLQFARLADVRITHVPYKGGAPSAQAVAAGDAQFTFATPASVQPMIDTGKVIGLAVTSAKRSPVLPNYPTLAEAGIKGYDISGWYGLFAPAQTPPAIIEKLFAASARALARPDLRAKLASRGEEVSPSVSPAEFKAFAQREGKTVAELTLSSGARID